MLLYSFFSLLCMGSWVYVCVCVYVKKNCHRNTNNMWDKPSSVKESDLKHPLEYDNKTNKKTKKKKLKRARRFHWIRQIPKQIFMCVRGNFLSFTVLCCFFFISLSQDRADDNTFGNIWYSILKLIWKLRKRETKTKNHQNK